MKEIHRRRKIAVEQSHTHVLTMGQTSVKVKFRNALLTLVIYQIVLVDVNCQPVDSECRVNGSTYFNCSSPIIAKEIYWYHYPVGAEAHERKSVYAYEKFYKDYEADFKLDKNSTRGVYNLVIRSVKPNYAGRYECQDNEGLGNSYSAQLIVLDSDPGCISNINSAGVIGPNTCEIPPEDLHLSCNVNYHGNIPPKLKWSRVGESEFISEKVSKGESANRIIYNITVRANQLVDNSSYECQTTNSRPAKYSCTSATLKLLYVNGTSSVIEKNVSDVVHCSANTNSQSCQYRWYQGENSLTISNNQTLKIQKAGQHRCKATCNLRNLTCTVVAHLVNVSSSGSGAANSTGVLVGVLVSVLLVVVFVILLILLFMWRRQSLRHKALKEDVEDLRMPVVGNSSPEMHALLPGATESNPIVIPDNEEENTKNAGDTHEEYPVKRKKTEEPRNEGIDYFLNPALLHVERFYGAEDEKASISGLTMLNKELFIVFESNSEVKVFQGMTYSYLRSFKVMELDNPLDIASSPQNNCLYISCPSKINRVDKNGRVIFKWPIEDGGGTLSVTDNQTVILSMLKRAALIEYSADGMTCHEIKLPSDVCPFHAVKISDHQFIVGYERGMVHRVSTVDMNGNIIQSFSGMLKFPKHLAVNRDGYIIVADQKNSRVLLMSSSLNSSKELLSKKDEISRPTKIYLDEANNQMFVADIKAEAQRFMVFKLQKHETEADIPACQDKSVESIGNLRDDQILKADVEDFKKPLMENSSQENHVIPDTSEVSCANVFGIMSSEEEEEKFVDAEDSFEKSQEDEPTSRKRKRSE